jgi:carboxypeptidase A4
MKKHSGIQYKVGPSGSLLYPASGDSDDWAKGELKIKYAYTVELRDTGKDGFILPASQIEPTGIETMELVYVFATAAVNA